MLTSVHLKPPVCRNALLRGSALLAGAMSMALMATSPARAQFRPLEMAKVSSIDFAGTYNLERAKVVDTTCSCFWLEGGSIEVGANFPHRIGAIANITGENASNIIPGAIPKANLSKIAYLFGPRYTHTMGPYSRVFGEFLVGGAHAFNTTFPSPGGAVSSASSFAMQMGGGLDFALGNGFGLRAWQLEYVRTTLPNNGSNSQNDVRLSFGLTYRLGEH